MSTEVFDSINEMKKVFSESQNAHLFTILPENFSTEELNAAKSDHDKMIEILNQFYKEHNHSSVGTDDFVTLFGVYCNYYLLYGLHLILKEDDFGTSQIFENISNSSLKKYLSLIRSGIYTQDVTHFEEAVKTNKNYSLAHFYLFLYYLRKYWNRHDAELEKEFLKHYKAIRNEELKKYALGLSDFNPCIINYTIKMGKHFLSSLMGSFFGSKFWEIMEEMIGTNDESFDVPPLPSPYLVTFEELNRLAYLCSAFLSWVFLGSICSLFCYISHYKVCCKNFSDTLSFIANAKEDWSEEEIHSNLLRFFEEHKIDPAIAIFFIDILFVFPVYLEETKKLFYILSNLHTLSKDDLIGISLKRLDYSIGQNYLSLAKVYEDSTIPKFFGALDKAEPETDKIDSKYMFWRSLFLNIPYVIAWTNQELSNLMERLIAEDEKDTMVRDFMHVYSNMAASNLYDIAQLLLKRDNPEDKETGRKLLLEYAVKMELKNSVRIMQLMYKDRVGELKDDIKKSLVSEEDEHEHAGDVLNKALRQCFINIFYGDAEEKASKEGTLSKIHKNLKNVWGENFLESKREQFE